MSGHGLGTHLLHSIIAFARVRGIREIHGDVLADNHRMLTLCRELGFTVAPDPGDVGVCQVALRL